MAHPARQRDLSPKTLPSGGPKKGLGSRTQITPERIEAFSKLMNEKLQNGDVKARKAYLRSVISVIEVDDKIVRIFGDKTQLAAALSEQNERTGKVRGLIRKWCGQEDSNLHPG